MNNKVQEIMKEIEKNPNIKLWKDFTWPEQIPLTARLKDILEKNVDEKYYLSGDKVESILANFIARQNEASGINLKNQATTFDGLTDVAHTLMARDYKGFGNQSMTGVIEPIIVASRGRNPENPSDRTTGSPTEQRLEANTSGTTNTITTVAKDNYVMEPVVCEQRCDEGLRFFKDNVVGTLRTIDACGDKRVIEPKEINPELVGGIGEKNFGKQYRQGNRVYSSDSIAMCLNAQPVGNSGGYSYLYAVKEEDVNPVRIGNIYGEQFGTGYAGNVWDQDSVSPTIMTAQGGNRQPLVVDNVKWRIRKLTPKECWRLMSFSDEDCNRASKYVSDSALYKQAGNSIVTSCLVAIFYSLLFNDGGTKWSDYIVQYKINGGNE